MLSAGLDAESIANGQKWTITRVCAEYLQYCERSFVASATSRSHRDGCVSYLNDLCGYCGELTVSEIKRSDVQAWIESHAGWRSRATHRIAKVKAEHVEDTPRGMMWRVCPSKTKKTRKIPVRPEVAALTRKLMKTAPTRSGLPLFRNLHGNPWKQVTGVRRFLTIKSKLGWVGDDPRARYSSYSCRHSFAHRILSGYWNGGAGCSIEVLAELLGDSPAVAFQRYGKEWGQHYQEPLWAAFGMS
jgi:integrase